MKFSTAQLSDCGGREKNDDAICIRQSAEGLCIFVGDGLGGYNGGELASHAAADAIMECFANRGMFTEQEMLLAAKLADFQVKELQKKQKGQMKTTMVVLTLSGQKARWMHVGDTRLYHFRDGSLVEQTMDHSVSQVAVLMGEIRQEEIRFHEDRNRVLRALGSENSKPDISEQVTLSGGREAFLLCTDGFWEYVLEEEMEAALKAAETPADWLKRLEQHLKRRITKENDNYSAAAVFAENR